jgi:hypothetical protein
MRYSLKIQRDAIREAIRARFAMVIPILRGMLYSTNRAMIEALGGYDKITLEQFARVYQENPGDYGICFEYAVHQSIRRRDPAIHPLLSGVLEEFCGIVGGAESILFGVEKTGEFHLRETAGDLLTDESRVLVGRRGQPVKLKRRLNDLVAAFRSERHREKLPYSIRGLWKADLFVGSPGPDQWVGTSLKTNRADLEPYRGLRLGLYPEERPGHGPRRDEATNLVLCPLPYSGDFMQLFGASFWIVKHLVAANAKPPSRIALVYEDDQAVARWLSDRRGFPVLGVIDALLPIQQPGLFDETEDEASPPSKDGEETVAAAPIPLKTS